MPLLCMAADGECEDSLQQAFQEVSRLLEDVRAWENDRETIFELLRRACVLCSRRELLDVPSVNYVQMESVWLFIIELRKRNPSRRRRIEEVSQVLLEAAGRWRKVVEDSSKIQDALRELETNVQRSLLHMSVPEDGNNQIITGIAGAEVPTSNYTNGNPFQMAPGAEVPTSNHTNGKPFKSASRAEVPNSDHINGNRFQTAPSTAGNGTKANLSRDASSNNPFASAPAAPKNIGNNPFKASAPVVGSTPSPTHVGGCSPKSASPSSGKSPNSGKWSQLSPRASTGASAFSMALQPEDEQKPGLGHRIGNGVGSAVSSAAEFNKRHGVTDKIGRGAVSAASQACDFEKRHQLTSRAAAGAHSAFVATKNVNEKYHVTEKIGQGVVGAASQAREFEKRHQVTSRTAAAAHSAFTAAKDANQKYHVSEKIGQGVVAGVHKAREIEQKHQVTSRIASGVSSGVDAVGSAVNGFRQSRQSSGQMMGPGSNPFAASPYPEQQRQPAQHPYAEGSNGAQRASTNPFSK